MVAARLVSASAAGLVFSAMRLDSVSVGVRTMNHRTLVAGLAVLGLGLAVVPDVASARAGGVAVGGGRVMGGFHRVVPRTLVRPHPLVSPRLSPHPFVNAGRGHIGRNAPFRHHARRHNRNRFDDQPSVNVVPSSDDYPYGGGPMNPAYTGALPQTSEQDTGSDLAAMARACKSTTTMVPSETRGGMVPITVTRCRPQDE